MISGTRSFDDNLLARKFPNEDVLAPDQLLVPRTLTRTAKDQIYTTTGIPIIRLLPATYTENGYLAYLSKSIVVTSPDLTLSTRSWYQWIA